MLERVLYERLLKTGFIKILSVVGGGLIAKGLVSEGDWTPAVSNFAEVAAGVVILMISGLASVLKEKGTVLFQRYLAEQATKPTVTTASAALSNAAADMKASSVPDPGPIPMTNTHGVRKLLGVLLAFGMLAGCASTSTPAVTPDQTQRRVAAEGLRAVALLQEARTFAKEAYATKTIDAAQYKQVLDTMEIAGEQIGKLADVLIAYETATTLTEQQTLAGQAKAILASLETVLPNVSPGLGGVTNKITDLIDQIKKIRDTINAFQTKAANGHADYFVAPA